MVWPFSTIKALRAKISQLGGSLDEERALTTDLREMFHKGNKDLAELRGQLRIARDQREDFRIRMDNAIADVAKEQAAAQSALGMLRASERKLTEISERLEVALKNDARDKATGKYVRGSATDAIAASPAAARPSIDPSKLKVSKARKPKAVKA